MTAVSVLKLFPETKEQQDHFVSLLVNQVLNGEINPLDVEIQMAQIEQVVKKFRSNEDVQRLVLQEAEKYNQKTFEHNNAKISIKEVGTKYNYAASEDWNIANEKANEAIELRKAIEKRLQTASKNAPYTDITSGEEITAIGKSSTTRAIIEINKK
ncbi:hypothetical protein D0T49_04435 [Paludibacter sp. 221]|uniref:hypothetical protein n=1 Tax=Paludibacter sp. 221 TaxID=2302939 RepID=UPI0013D549A7|nr:hypothetical protein [Paludibacter sp. 221]NDV46285.1 hypothetical protein [Paludibacter sp. 221]